MREYANVRANCGTIIGHTRLYVLLALKSPTVIIFVN